MMSLPARARIPEEAMREIKETIREFILSTYLPGESPENLRDDTPLQTSGILDSLATMGVITFLEKRFRIELDVYDTAVERFDRIDDIAASVLRKQGR
jgi:acyl carrier protein